MLGHLWLTLALTTPLAKTETAKLTQHPQVALMFALMVLNNALLMVNTKSVETTILTLVWNGQLATLAQVVKLVRVLGCAPILALTNALQTKRCVFLTPLTRLVL